MFHFGPDIKASVCGINFSDEDVLISFFSEQSRYVVLAAVEDTDDVDLVFVHMEGNGDSPAIVRDTQARTDIFALVPTIGEVLRLSQ